MKKPKTLRQYVERVAVIGVAFGVGIGVGIDNIGYGIGIGIIIGAATGALLYANAKKKGKII